jgi:uncharacterized protein YcbK (DUF882 family)
MVFIAAVFSVSSSAVLGQTAADTVARPVRIVHAETRESLTVSLITKMGTVSTRSRQLLSQFTRDRQAKQRAPLLHSRLFLMLQRIADRFPNSPIEIISAHRSPLRGVYDEHALGRAVDFRIPGVSTEVVYEFVKTLPNCGTGHYPKAGFVHLDVRDSLETWIDHTHTFASCEVGQVAPVEDQRIVVEPIQFLSLWNNETVWLQLVTETGVINNRARQTLSRLAASKEQAEHIPLLHPRLLLMLQKVSDQYPGRRFELISGFRYGEKDWTSLHNFGRAIDFRITGVDRKELYDFIRTLPKCGTGYYPNSVFVHLDVRERSTTWVDYSGVGEPADYGKRSE